MVSRLDEFEARPEQSLKDHLIQAAFSAGSPDGSQAEQMLFLAGLLHDAGKAGPTWQAYLKRSVAGGSRDGKMPHAYVGAALFALYARRLLDSLPSSLENEQFYYLLIRDIQDHHTQLRDWSGSDNSLLVEAPWSSSMVKYPPTDIDFAGLDTLVLQYIPLDQSASVPNYDTFKLILADVQKRWPRNLLKHQMRLEQELGAVPSEYAPWICRNPTGLLAAADRLSASGLDTERSSLTSKKASQALLLFKQRLEEKRLKAMEAGRVLMAEKRSTVHQETIDNFLTNRNDHWFTLNLPVGWGKTLISIRAALEQAASSRTERIVYVAPYLAILAQAAEEIRVNTGLEVLEHHHLALLNEQVEAPEPVDVLTMESWRAPIVATTFNQLFRAVFPKSAQQSLRVPALKHAFIVVDEPQIINASVYNAFLRGLEVLCERLEAQVLLVSATLPPTYHALTKAPAQIAPKVESAQRFVLKSHDEGWTEERLAEEAVERLGRHGHTAVILNTIADAVRVYRKISSKKAEDVVCLNLHGMMTPLHKARRIFEISTRLTGDKPTLVISTQVIEAGVDLSFRCILRARPVLSSVLQAAGRANRHAEGRVASVEVFDLIRENGRDIRKVIYSNAQQRQVTDEFLQPASEWSEAQATKLVEQYFDKLGLVDANIAVFKRFQEAAGGRWSRLAGLSPFETLDEGDGNEMIERVNARVFVATTDEWFNQTTKEWFNYFKKIDDLSIGGVRDLYETYKDARRMAKLSFVDRRRFVSLVSQFVAPLRWRLVPQICGNIDPESASILRAQNDDQYHLDTGFGHLLLREDFDTFELNLESAMSRSHDNGFL